MEMQSVKSSFVQAVGYDPESQTLHVQFNSGKLARFAGVTADDHAKLMGAESIGRHFGQYIRGKFDHVAVEPETQDA